jgi:L-lactate dehydrogenase complex protein LldF
VAADSRDYQRLACRILAETPEMRDSVTGAALTFDQKRLAAYGEIDCDGWRAWAEQVKSHMLTNLDGYLEDAERNLIRNGAEVHWAETAEDARTIVGRLAQEYGVGRLVKAKSMLSEELAINAHLEALGVEVFETDLGQYIIQLLEEPPSHVVAPAIHRELDEICALFSEKFGTPPGADPDELAAAARKVLRQAFLSADMGMSGGNFLVAETGTLALIENEGNIRLSTSAPPVHVALVGIEKLLPRLSDLAGFLQLTARAALGMRIGTFVSLIQGPRTDADPDGPEAVHVVLVDNGRSRILADPQMWEMLRCVRCGACQNACPVFRQTGGHAYGWVYGGPIGSILAPGLLGPKEAGPLPYASTLCGACEEACPVRIPIPRLLLEWRNRSVESRPKSPMESIAMSAYSSVMTSPFRYRVGSRALRVLPGLLGLRLMHFMRAWSRHRAELKPSRKSFRDLWEGGIEQ